MLPVFLFVGLVVRSCLATSGCTSIDGDVLCFDFDGWTFTCEAYWGEFSNPCSACTVCSDSTFGYSCELQAHNPCNVCINRSCEDGCVGAFLDTHDCDATPSPTPPEEPDATEIPTMSPSNVPTVSPVNEIVVAAPTKVPTSSPEAFTGIPAGLPSSLPTPLPAAEPTSEHEPTTTASPTTSEVLSSSPNAGNGNTTSGFCHREWAAARRKYTLMISLCAFMILYDF